MRATRRSFLGGCAAVTVAGPSALAAESPVLKIGIVTDTHVVPDPESCRPVQAAWELFRRERTDAVFNLGDIADLFDETAYRNYRAAVDAAFVSGAWKPDELYVWASHDAFGYKGSTNRAVPPDRHDAFAEAARLLRSPNGEWAEREWKGYPFLVFPMYLDLSEYRGRYEETIRLACETHPGKPVFLLDHIPPVGTVQNSDHWGDWRRTEVLSRYPQVVDLTGHVHGSLRNENLIWQGAYTVVNFGCMTVWGGGLVGAEAPGGISRGAGILEVYPDRLVVRRFNDVVNAPESEDPPWTIPWPFDPKTAPYSAATKRRQPAPAFADAARLQFDPATLTLAFPEAEDGGPVYLYRIRAQTQVREIYSQFAVDRPRRGLNRVTLDTASLPGGAECRFTVTPVGFGLQEGHPLTLETTLPARPSDVLRATCVLSDPMRKLDFRWESWCTPKAPDADGFVRTQYDDEITFGFPATAFAGRSGSRFRVTMDLSVDVSDGFGYSVELNQRSPRRRFSRTKTVSGRGARMRLVTSCEKGADGSEIIVWIGRATGRFRIDRVTVEEVCE